MKMRCRNQRKRQQRIKKRQVFFNTADHQRPHHGLINRQDSSSHLNHCPTESQKFSDNLRCKKRNRQTTGRLHKIFRSTL